MKKHYLITSILITLCLILCMLPSIITAQVAVTTDGSNADPSAMLDVKSDTAGVLFPRMTQIQREAINSPAAGLLVYQNDNTAGFYYYTGTDWIGLVGTGSGAISASTFIDCDGNTYPTITIGTQVWIAENLRVTHYRNGDAIANITDEAAWGALSTGAYCWYNNDQTTNEKYGVLYNWYAVDDSRGLCPEGWHIPTSTEWTTLTTYLGGYGGAGGKMKSTSNLWNSPNTDATNASKFSGLPGGYRSNIGIFNGIGIGGYLWSSTEYSSFNAQYRHLNYINGIVNEFNINKPYGFSVRCLRD